MKLIDADELFRLIKGQKVKETGAYSKGLNSGLNIAMSILKDVNQTPTAYDIDKVVEELKELRAEINRQAESAFMKEHNAEVRADAIDELVRMVARYYTAQERAGYYSDTNNMIKQRIADFGEQLKNGK